MAFFSFFFLLLSRVSLAHRGPCAEASHPAPPTGVPSAEWLPPTPQLRRAVCISGANDTAVPPGIFSFPLEFFSDPLFV